LKPWSTNLLKLGTLCVLMAVRSGWAAVWQWSVPVDGGRESAGPARAFLWIPEDCKVVRAAVVAQHNLEEIAILEHPKFRQALTELGFAEVWCAPAFDHLFRFNEKAGKTFDTMMADLAHVSGYKELKKVPVAALGHSAAASWPYYFAAWNPERTLAAISVSGQWPYFRDKNFAPDIWGGRNIDYVPCLETMGEYESATTWSKEGLAERTAHRRMPLSMLACPAEGHFAPSVRKVEYLALYLKKAAQYRLGPPLKPIDPTKSGWLVDRWRLNQAPTAPAAPVDQYTGDPKQAFWCFDEELAQATEAYQAAYRGKKAQLLGYVQGGQVVPQGNTHQQVTLKFLPEADGVTFHLAGTFLDKVPAGSPRPAGWTGLAAGSPVGHATGGGDIVIDRICGPFVKVSPDTFRVQWQRGLGANQSTCDLWFAATHPGDDQYKPAVQQALLTIPVRNSAGAPQHITFPALGDMAAATTPVQLTARCDSGLPVSYYVREGPAEVDGSTLRLTAIPPRSVFPVKATVVAWQWGRSSEPCVQTAEPVEQTFIIGK